MLILGVERAHAGSQSPCSQRGKPSCASWKSWRVGGGRGGSGGKEEGSGTFRGRTNQRPVNRAGGFSTTSLLSLFFVFFFNWLSPQPPVVHVRVLVVLSE